MNSSNSDCRTGKDVKYLLYGIHTPVRTAFAIEVGLDELKSIINIVE